MVLQKELLYALLGYTGQVIVDSPDGFSLAKGVPLIDASERALISRLLVLGHCYRELEEFVNTQLFYGCESGEFPSPYFLALALGLDECLQPYRARVLELEQTLLRSPDLSLPSMQLGFGDFELTLPALRRLIAGVQQANLRGVALLDHLHTAAGGCVYSLRAHLAALLRHTQRVLRSQLAAWLLHGELLPGDGEFFIERRAASATDGESKGADAEAPSWRVGSARAIDNVLRGGWFAFDIAVARKPAFLPMRVAERILFIGKAVRVLRAAEQRDGDVAQRPTTPHTTAPRATWHEDDAAGARHHALAHDGLASPRYFAAREALGTSPGRSPKSVASPSSASPSPRHQQHDAYAAGVGRAVVGAGVGGARASLAEAERAVEAAELVQEHAAVKELEAESTARSLLSALAMTTPDKDGGRDGRQGDGGGRSGQANADDDDNARDGDTAASGATTVSAAHEMRLALHGFSDELRALPMLDGSLQLAPFERLLGQMQRTSSRLLWRHLTRECGLLELLSAVKNYLLLGRGNVFHTLLDELRPLMANKPPPLLDLQSVLAIATNGEPPDTHLASAKLTFAGSVPSDASPYDQWRALTLELQVDWPLHLLVHAEARKRYGELFRFLLLVKRVQCDATPPPRICIICTRTTAPLHTARPCARASSQDGAARGLEHTDPIDPTAGRAARAVDAAMAIARTHGIPRRPPAVLSTGRRARGPVAGTHCQDQLV